MNSFIVHDTEVLRPVAEAFVRQFRENPERSVFAFHGDMGAGKTTFIAEICRILGVEDDVASPSFSLINEYLTDAGPVFHFDFYRLKSAAEAADIGTEDYLYSGALCLLEWPQRVEEILPDDTAEVNIEILPDGSRRITF